MRDNTTPRADIESKADLAVFLRELARKIENGEVELQNARVAAYIDSISRWLQHAEVTLPEQTSEYDSPSWRDMAIILESGVYYE